MAIAQALLAEFENEAKMTRPFLERVPADKLGWKPHPKSMSLGQLALHVASVPGGVIQMAKAESIPAPSFAAPPEAKSVQELLDTFDASIAKVREVLPQIDDRAMAGTWSAILDGKPVLSMPRVAVLRNILLNHWYQHRGQFGVYLRMLDVPVPSTYGPSADEPPSFLKA